MKKNSKFANSKIKGSIPALYTKKSAAFPKMATLKTDSIKNPFLSVMIAKIGSPRRCFRDKGRPIQPSFTARSSQITNQPLVQKSPVWVWYHGLEHLLILCSEVALFVRSTLGSEAPK
jgi:hypothetical protein